MSARWFVSVAVMAMLAAPKGSIPLCAQEPEGRHPGYAKRTPQNDGDFLPPGAVRRFGTLRFRHPGSFGTVAWSADGKVIATPIGDQIWLWDPLTGKVVRRMRGRAFAKEGWPITSFRFSPNGSRMAGAYYDKGIRVWEFGTGKPICDCQGIAFVFSANGKTIYAGGHRSHWTINNLETCYILDHKPIRRWDTVSGKELAPLGRGVPFAVSADGKLLAAISGDVEDPDLSEVKFKNQLITLWETETRREVGRLPIEHGLFEKGVFSPGGLSYHVTLGFGKQKGAVYFWATHAKPRRLSVKCSWEVHFSQDGKRLASVADGGPLQIWDLPSGEKLDTLKRLPRIGLAVAFSQDNQKLAFGGRNAFAVWDLTAGKEVSLGEGHINAIAGAALSRDGRRLCTTGENEPTYLWDVSTGGIIRAWRHPNGYGFGNVTFSPDDKLIAACGGNLYVWEADSGKLRYELSLTPNDRLGCPTFSPDGRYLAAGCGNRDELLLWDADTGKKVKEHATGGGVASLAFSPDGRIVAVGGGSTTIRLLSTFTGMLQTQLPSPTGDQSNQHLLFSATGRTLLFSQLDKIRLWETATNGLRLEIGNLRHHVHTIAISPDNRLLATGDNEGIQLWDAVSGKELQRFIAHRGGVSKVCFSADSRHLLSAGCDTTAVLWRVPERILPAKTRVSRDELVASWRALCSGDAREAYRAQARLLTAADSLSFFREKLQPVPHPDPAKVARWIADLNDAGFRIRENATRELENQNDAVKPALLDAVKKPLSLETRRRLERLLSRLETLSQAQLQALRAIEVLEWIGTTEARGLLAQLSQGAPGAFASLEARRTLGRLAGK